MDETQGTKPPSREENQGDRSTQVLPCMADKFYRTVRCDNLTFYLMSAGGDIDSISGYSIDELRTWHESRPDFPHPVSQGRIRGPKGFSKVIYYAEDRSQLRLSYFFVQVKNTDPKDKRFPMSYWLQVLHEPGQRGQPVHFAGRHRTNNRTVAWAFGWDSQKGNFNERPLALQMNVKTFLVSRAETEAQNLKAFAACPFEISNRRMVRIRKELSEKAHGWKIMGETNNQPTESSGK